MAGKPNPDQTGLDEVAKTEHTRNADFMKHVTDWLHEHDVMQKGNALTGALGGAVAPKDQTTKPDKRYGKGGPG